jgi:hypothetical protein
LRIGFADAVGATVVPAAPKEKGPRLAGLDSGVVVLAAAA